MRAASLESHCLTCATAGRSSRAGPWARLKRRTCLRSCSLASATRTSLPARVVWWWAGRLAGWQQVIGRGRALDVPWAKGGRLVSCGHRSSQPARLSDTSMPVVSLAIHTQTLSLSHSHSSLFTPQTHCRREYTPFSTARRPGIGSDPLPPLLLLPCLPSSTLSGLLPHLPFPGSTKHDLMI